MLRPYRAVLATPGALAFSAAGFVARMPISMVGLGIVILVESRTGSYGLAGAVSGAFALTNALSAPVLARFVDRYGQRRVSVPAVAVHAVGLSSLVALVQAEAPRWTYFVAAVVASGAFPAIGAMVRARWTHALGGSPSLQTAYSLEAVVDELIFVTGPPLVTVLATAWSGSGLGVALLLLVTGSTALFSQRATEPPPHPADASHATMVIRLPGMLVILLVSVCLGAIFGAVEVTAVAFAEARDAAAGAGVILALYAAGSMAGGLAYGIVTWRTPLRRRFLLGAVAMAATLVPLPFVDTFLGLGPLALLAGVAIAPTMIANVALVQQIVPTARFNEGLAWSFAGLGVGIAFGAAVAGALIDARGPSAGFTLAVAAGAAAVATCAVGYRGLGKVTTASSGVAAPK